MEEDDDEEEVEEEDDVQRLKSPKVAKVVSSPEGTLFLAVALFLYFPTFSCTSLLAMPFTECTNSLPRMLSGLKENYIP